MPKPRIFVSSTYYDLKHIRSSLDIFIENLGFEAVLSEKGEIAYTSEVPLDESCYREAANSDILIIIIGGRYGSEASDQSVDAKTFYSRYDSITKKELQSAVDKEKPIYVLIDSSVMNEYQTFKNNRSNDNVAYAHVDSVNIFHLIDDIIALPKNNPVKTFDKYSDIEYWLREQWSGLFRELLIKSRVDRDISGLSDQVAALKETNATLKNYLESIIRSVEPEKSASIIKEEEESLTERRIRSKIASAPVIQYISDMADIEIDDVVEAVLKAEEYKKFVNLLTLIDSENDGEENKIFFDQLLEHSVARKDYIDLLKEIGLFNSRARRRR